MKREILVSGIERKMSVLFWLLLPYIKLRQNIKKGPPLPGILRSYNLLIKATSLLEISTLNRDGFQTNITTYHLLL